jgi:hypothetical protein
MKSQITKGWLKIVKELYFIPEYYLVHHIYF